MSAAVESRSGQGRIRVAVVDGISSLVELAGGNPLKLIPARQRGRSCLVYPTTFGGGLVAGDAIDLAITVEPDARLVLAGQASTKIYRRDERGTSVQTARATVGSGGLLIHQPDPVTCFTGADYRQQQTFDLAADGDLFAVDWLTAGRMARGEAWAFTGYASRTDISIAGRLVGSERIWLSDAQPGPSVADRLAGVGIIATVWLAGPRMASLIPAVEAAQGEAPRLDAAVVESLSPVAEQVWLWRLAGPAVEPVVQRVYAVLDGCAEWCGERPWRRKG